MNCDGLKNTELTTAGNELERPAAGAPGVAGGPPAGLPCLTVTVACKAQVGDAVHPLPGPRRKQADALVENIKWLALIFGPEHIGFVTLTVGDIELGGKFRNLRDRKEAQRRFHSFLTNELSRRYPRGVVVTERHQNGGIHFHLVVVTLADIRGTIDFAACFPPKDSCGKPVYKPNYGSANAALKIEWAHLRRVCGRYGFGRHQLQPMRENGEALGRYVGGYLKKDWEYRWPEDKGARCIRYFGHWSTVVRQRGQRCQGPPNTSQFGWIKPRARAWREMIKQVVIVVTYKGDKISEANIKEVLGTKWAWNLGRLLPAVRFIIGDWQDSETRAAIAEHNAGVRKRWLDGGGDPAQECWWDITEITLDHLRPSPAWQKQMADLQLAKESEAEIRRRLRVRKPSRATPVCQPVLANNPAPTKLKPAWSSWLAHTCKED